MGHEQHGPGAAVTVPRSTRVVHYDPAAGRDPQGEQRALEAAIRDVLARDTLLHGHQITVTAGPQGLVTLTGFVATQALRREVELACWTRPALRTLHDRLVVGCSVLHLSTQ
jgi:hypothetical protein